MAQVTTEVVTEGPSSLVLRVNLLSDGTGELVNYPFLTSAGANLPLPPTSVHFVIRQIWYGFSWFDVVLSQDVVAPVPFWTLARGSGNYFDFRYFGGIRLNKTVPPFDSTGNILLSTNNFGGSAGNVGHMIVDFQKMNT